MAFKSVENSGNTMAEGDYEVICLTAKEGETKGGTPVIKLDFQVRSDVEQKYQRKHIFKNFYKDDETGEWPAEKIGKYANSMGIPKDTEFELADLEGKCLILHMKPYETKDGAKIDTINWTAPTKAGQVDGTTATAVPTNPVAYMVVDDEEDPF